MKISTRIAMGLCCFFTIVFAAEKFTEIVPKAILSVTPAEIATVPNQTYKYIHINSNSNEGIIVNWNTDQLKVNAATISPGHFAALSHELAKRSEKTLRFNVPLHTASPKPDDLIMNMTDAGIMFRTDPLTFTNVLCGSRKLTCEAPHDSSSLLRSIIVEFNTTGECVNLVDGAIDFAGNSIKGLAHKEGLLFLGARTLQLQFK